MILTPKKNHYTHARGKQIIFFGNTVNNVEESACLSQSFGGNFGGKNG